MAIKPVSFKTNEEHLIKYAEEHGGFSYYVKELIRKDMQGLNNQTAPAVPQFDMAQLVKMMQEQIQLTQTIETPAEKPKKEDTDIADIDMTAVDGILGSLGDI